mmetsp:Transcript_22850/g.28798  ORF Transcript_22850/g.28798 Transcript_22850/m.28798 type:complete len:134 (+) Transcript_22850:204-605(+)
MPFNFAAISKAMSSSAGKRSTSPRSPSPTPPSPAAFAVGFNPSAKQTGLTTPPVPFTNNRPFVTNTSPSPKKKSRTVTSIQVGSFVSYNAKVKNDEGGWEKMQLLGSYVRRFSIFPPYSHRKYLYRELTTRGR